MDTLDYPYSKRASCGAHSPRRKQGRHPCHKATSYIIVGCSGFRSAGHGPSMRLGDTISNRSGIFTKMVLFCTPLLDATYDHRPSGVIQRLCDAPKSFFRRSETGVKFGISWLWWSMCLFAITFHRKQYIHEAIYSRQNSAWYVEFSPVLLGTAMFPP